MKATGIVRKVDELGRIVLPIEVRRMMDISEKDPIEIFVDGESILLRKHYPVCVFCGKTSLVQLHKEKNICSRCISELKGHKA